MHTLGNQKNTKDLEVYVLSYSPTPFFCGGDIYKPYAFCLAKQALAGCSLGRKDFDPCP